MNKEEYIAGVRKLLYEYSDEIPAELLHSTGYDSNGNPFRPKFKCRRGWFMGVYGTCELGKDLGFVDEETFDMFQALHAHLVNTNYIECKDPSKKRTLTTRQDIDIANKMLEQIIERLS